uniref:Uncharacterized protein n=1 Tax=Alexandrium andersonii TaxID=327968 RepID=A0A7S2G7Y7_9DINO|mmetsp:Transcript_44663/g.101497  ORF Transcript_44663/g.101497 Transcript_44663/m.101497 type:complete len:320 (+) Transcript_44663:63-1022(+)
MLSIRSPLAAAAACAFLYGQPSAAIDDQSSLVQRYAEEPAKPAIVDITKYDWAHPKIITNPAEIYKPFTDGAMAKGKQLADETWSKMKEVNGKIVSEKRSLHKLVKEKVAVAGSDLNKVRKQVMAKIPPLWRKERNGTDYGLLDGQIAKARALYYSKMAKKGAEAAVKGQEIARKFNDDVVKAIPQGMLPLLPSSITGGAGPDVVNSDEFGNAGSYSPSDDSKPATDGASWYGDHVPQTEMEIAEAVHKFREAEKKASIKSNKTEFIKTLKTKSELEKEEERIKREKERIAEERRKLLNKEKEEQDAAVNPQIWEEGVE